MNAEGTFDSATGMSGKDIENLLKKLEERITGSIDDRISQALAKANPQPPLTVDQSFREKSSSRPTEWADQVDSPDYSEDISHLWRDDDPEPVLTAKLSEPLTELVNEAFTSSLPSSKRREIRGNCPTPDMPLTRCPRVDAIFKAPESRFAKNTEGKALDTELMKVQAYILDVAPPILELLQALERDPEDPEMPRPPDEVLRDALRLLGNAVFQVSKIRRKKILKICNPDIQDLADNEETFKSAAPNLFGENFEKKMKERAEAVKILNKSQSQSGTNSRSFFRSSHPPWAQRGGGSFRSARGRFSPMGSSQGFGQSWRQKGSLQPQRKKN